MYGGQQPVPSAPPGCLADSRPRHLEAQHHPPTRTVSEIHTSTAARSASPLLPSYTSSYITSDTSSLTKWESLGD
ncbi:unnamed protein product [Parajaminaea phylloscopi]